MQILCAVFARSFFVKILYSLVLIKNGSPYKIVLVQELSGRDCIVCTTLCQGMLEMLTQKRL